MLPSQGLFKIYQCPLFESGNCTRPYCHYKHTKKDDEHTKTKTTDYTPTPIQRPLTLLTLETPFATSNSKKQKLEYTPTKPAINDDHSKNQKYCNIDDDIPVYKPSNIINSTQEVNPYQENNEEDGADFSETDESKQQDAAEDDPKEIENNEENGEESIAEKEFEGLSLNSNAEILSSNLQEQNASSQSSEEDRIEENALSEKIETDVSKEEKASKQQKPHRSSNHKRSHSDDDRHKSRHRSSSSSKHKNSHGDKYDSYKSKSESHKNDKRTSNSSSSSRHSSSRSHHKSSSSSSRHKSSSSDKERSSSSSKHKSNSSSKSKSSHKSNKRRSKSREKISSITAKTDLMESIPSDSSNFNIPSPSSIFDSSDEDEVMEQCKMIFEEFNANNHQEIKKPELPLKRPVEEEEDDKYDEYTKRKRVAHENALKVEKPISQGAIKKPNHIKNAMQSIYQRQEYIRKKQAEEAAAAAEAATAAVKEAEERLKAAEEALKQTTVKQQQLTPLIPKIYLQPGKSTAAAMKTNANILALERAKKKIEELKAQKCGNNLPTVATPAQTAMKGAGRVAHKATTVATAVVDTRIAPPVLEASSTKISYNIRMQYYNLMVKQCLIIYPNCEDAWDRAQTEELAVFKKCSTPIIYKSSALLTINKLKKEAADAGNVNVDKSKTISHDVILAGKLGQSTSWSVKSRSNSTLSSLDPFDRLSAGKAYDLVFELILTEEQLRNNGFPRSGKRPGRAVMKEVYSKPKPPNEDERYCCRCSKLFKLEMYDEEAVDECNYHPKGTGYRRGFPDNSHLCCQQPAGSEGCTYANYHVTDFIDYNNLKGFVTTIDRGSDYVPTKKDIYALDCEMCYTTQGVELTRVTVVDINSRTVYDGLVKPENKIIDYNTVYSGITKEMLENETRSLRDVQAVLLSMFHSQTILIGHSLESDLKVLKIIHNNVVDTSVLFPHRQGPPKKRALKTLCIENLKRIIQENEKGHDSAEDAEVCIQLVKFYLRNKVNN